MTTAKTTPIPPAATASSARDRISHVLVAMPDTILLPFLWLCVTVSVTIVLHVFTPWLVIPVTAAAAIATWRWHPRFEVTRASTRSALVALIGVAVWLGANLPFASNWLYVSQDPGFIALQGVWLSHHSSSSIPAAQAAHIATQIQGASAGTGSFNLVGNQLDIQGAKLVPGLLAVGGWFGGIHGVLAANLVIGAIGLLAFFALARQIIGPIWSVAATASLAISMPFIVFTRSSYTEPIVLALTFGGLVLLWRAVKDGRWQGFLAGGALVGAGGLARIDGAAVVLGLTVGLALVTAAARNDERRRSLRRGYFVATGAALVLTIVGWLDLRLDSPVYLYNLQSEWHELFAVLAAGFVVGGLICWKHPWHGLRHLFTRHARIVGGTLGVLALLAAVVLTTRPIWYTAHGAANSTIAGLQAQQGLPVDATRTYDEQSVTWLAMYFSWIIVIAGFLGITLALINTITRRHAGLAVVISTIAMPSVLYLWSVQNTPEQLWVMRRYLPVTMPGLLLFAALLFVALIGWLGRNLTAMRLWIRRVVVVVGAVGFAFPLYTNTQSVILAVPQYRGQLAQVRNICAALDGRPAVLIDDGAYFPTVRTMCNVQTFETLGNTSTMQLKQIRAAFDGKSPVVITFVASQMPWAGSEPPATVDNVVLFWQPSLNERPSVVSGGHQTIWMGTIDPTGHVVPIPPVS